MHRPIFRKVALERLSSPEQLDQLMQVTNPRGWVALAALVTLLLAAIVWGVLGSIPTEIVGNGILLRGGRTFAIVMPSDGTLLWIAVEPGQKVQHGQMIASLDDGTPVLSPSAGRISEVLVDQGDRVLASAPLASIEPDGQALAAVLFTPFSDGSTIRPGMEVRVVPANVSAATYGSLRGTVEYVATAPATRASMQRILENDLLVDQFLARGVPVIVRVRLQPDDQTPSGYRWSSPNGPPMKIPNGMLCQATITLGRQRPISLIIPQLRP